MWYINPFITLNAGCKYIQWFFEIRAFRASKTTHFAVGQPSINLMVSVGQPDKNL